MTESANQSRSAETVEDFPKDVKEFLLAYPGISRAIALARREGQRVNMLIESKIAAQDWFNTSDFQTRYDHRVFQVWKRNWRSNVTPGCPWIHMEHSFNWDGLYLETRLDVEGERLVPQAPCVEVAGRLAEGIRALNPMWFSGGGWILHEGLRGRNILLLRTENCVREDFAASWFVDRAVKDLGQLANVIPAIDAVVRDVFRDASVP